MVAATCLPARAVICGLARAQVRECRQANCKEKPTMLANPLPRTPPKNMCTVPFGAGDLAAILVDIVPLQGMVQIV